MGASGGVYPVRIGHKYRKILGILNPLFHAALSVFVHKRAKERVICMFLKKLDGPRAVTLPDGSVMTRADLPAPDTFRWVASRKAAVVRAVKYGLISRAEALERYGISDDEFDSWDKAVRDHGIAGLKATALQKYRQP